MVARRRCPGCRVEMVTRSADGLWLDACSKCRGIWFDAGELEAFRRRRALTARGRKALRLPTFRAHPGAEPWSCPGCEERALEPGTWGARLVHHCRDCEGYFVGESELRTLQRHATRAARRRAPEQSFVAEMFTAWYDPGGFVDYESHDGFR